MVDEEIENVVEPSEAVEYLDSVEEADSDELVTREVGLRSFFTVAVFTKKGYAYRYPYEKVRPFVDRLSNSDRIIKLVDGDEVVSVQLVEE